MWNCSLSGLLTAIWRLRANLSFFWMFGNLNQLDQFKTVSHTSWSWCRDLIKVWTLPLSSLTLFSGHQRSLALADLIRDNYSRTQGTENHRRWESPGSGGEKWGRCELSGDHMVWVISVWNQNPAAASSSRVKLTNNSLALAITLHTILEDRKKKNWIQKVTKLLVVHFSFWKSDQTNLIDLLWSCILDVGHIPCAACLLTESFWTLDHQSSEETTGVQQPNVGVGLFVPTVGFNPL